VLREGTRANLLRHNVGKDTSTVGARGYLEMSSDGNSVSEESRTESEPYETSE
jgi:hypothetical protein